MSTFLPAVPDVLARLPRRLRLALATRPLAYWLATGAVAALAGLVVHAAVAGAADVRHRFGTLRPTVVATRALVPGDVLDASNTEVRELPLAVVAAGALAELPVGGAVVAAGVPAGEPIQAGRVGRAGDGPVAALLADGARGIAVPLDDGARLPLRIGDRVDVIAAVVAAPGGGASVVAAGAAVVAVGERSVVVGVAAAEAPAVAQALADGGVVLALSAGR